MLKEKEELLLTRLIKLNKKEMEFLIMRLKC
jgi:hypothetical protein